jgi:hypothetical protein
MSRILGSFVFLGLVVCAVSADDKKPVGALMPLPIDKAFEKANGKDAITNALLNDPTFKKAVQAAAKAKADRIAAMKTVPIGPTPEQAARAEFLRVLSGEDHTVLKPDQK